MCSFAGKDVLAFLLTCSDGFDFPRMTSWFVKLFTKPLQVVANFFCVFFV